jgi:gamma-glutamylcyclotransferase
VDKKIDISAVPEKKQMLLYIDRKRTKDDKPREDNIYRMNMGIIDALKVGIPSSYVEKVMRKFIPEMDDLSIQDFWCRPRKNQEKVPQPR